MLWLSGKKQEVKNNMNCFLMDSLQEALSQTIARFIRSFVFCFFLPASQLNSSLAYFVFCPTTAAACEHVLFTTLFASFGLSLVDEDDDDGEGFSCKRNKSYVHVRRLVLHLHGTALLI